MRLVVRGLAYPGVPGTIKTHHKNTSELVGLGLLM